MLDIKILLPLYYCYLKGMANYLKRKVKKTTNDSAWKLSSAASS